MPNGLPDSRPPRGSNTHNSCVLQAGREQTLGSPRDSGKSQVQIWEEGTALQILRSLLWGLGVWGLWSHQLICCPREG